MKPYFWLVLFMGAATGCSSGDTGQSAKCAALNDSCSDPSECCPGSICTQTLLDFDHGTCTQTCKSGADCDSGCCHSIDGTSDKVCDFAAACETGTGGTGGTNGSGGSGNMSTAGTATAGSGGMAGEAPAACEDADAPGQFPSDALQLDATTDCNNTPLKHAGEKLVAGDVDWFSYGVTDEAGCVINGSASVAGGDVELCAFGDLANCEISCMTGTTAAREGYTGCCTSGSDPKLAWITTCGITKSASGTIYLEVSPTSDACVSYQLGYGF